MTRYIPGATSVEIPLRDTDEVRIEIFKEHYHINQNLKVEL